MQSNNSLSSRTKPNGKQRFYFKMIESIFSTHSHFHSRYHPSIPLSHSPLPAQNPPGNQFCDERLSFNQVHTSHPYYLLLSVLARPAHPFFSIESCKSTGPFRPPQTAEDLREHGGVLLLISRSLFRCRRLVLRPARARPRSDEVQEGQNRPTAGVPSGSV